ncbi:MAG: thymidine phosphorylase [Aureliella sp.]
MLATSIIGRKRDNQHLTAEEIRFMVKGFLAGSIPAYQMSAWAMAIVCRGMEVEEVSALTDAMLASGSRLSRATERPRVDKHSTGGLGDKVSLVLAPLLACFDVDVPMLSGRGLGITGGTLDKLEAYAGYNCHLSQPQITRQLGQIGCVITGATADIAPADRQFYALRDVTGTVPSIALITSSIMSKKLAASLDALVLDVKFGSAAFMRDSDQARQLAASLCATGERFGVATRAVLSDMNQPLGRMVGNACEANEAVQVLQGAGPTDVRDLTLHLCAELLVAIGRFADHTQASLSLTEALTSGRGLARFQAMITAQGGHFDPHLELAPSSTLEALQGGWLLKVDGQQIGQTVIGLGGGRARLEQPIDHSVGLEMLVRIGDRVEAHQPLVRIFARSPQAAEQAAGEILAAMTIIEESVPPLPLIHTL